MIADGSSGSYVLLLQVGQPISVVFGRFQGGRPIDIPTGDVVYIGSALGGKLGSRLLRHATRTDGSAHTIRPKLQMRLRRRGIQASLPKHKKRYWHIDYLLDHPAVVLVNVLILQTPQRLEPAIAALLNADANTHLIAPRLGGSDDTCAHVLRVVAPDGWWHELPQRLAALPDLSSSNPL
ncbi:MAG: GIY-YIG nuclease family protein [Anaerolineae bacterium]|nr:GIY-YIG nuclease family protein [Anaerolineae bacterium]